MRKAVVIIGKLLRSLLWDPKTDSLSTSRIVLIYGCWKFDQYVQWLEDFTERVYQTSGVVVSSWMLDGGAIAALVATVVPYVANVIGQRGMPVIPTITNLTGALGFGSRTESDPTEDIPRD